MTIIGTRSGGKMTIIVITELSTVLTNVQNSCNICKYIVKYLLEI